jgi:hypothetical protein
MSVTSTPQPADERRAGSSEIKSNEPKSQELKPQRPLLVSKVPVAAVKSKPPGVAPATRVDLPPESGYSVVVDGHFKGHHAAEPAALADAKALKAKYPFLRIEIFDAVKKTRANVG